MTQNKLAIMEKNEVARPLKVLVPLINDALDHAHEAGIEYRRQAGALFQEAKIHFRGTPEWIHWIGRTFKHRETNKAIGKSTIYTWIELSDAIKEFSPARRIEFPFRTQSEFTHPHRESHHQPAWHAPVRDTVERVDVERLIQEKQDKEKESRLIHDLAIQLIDIGFKVLATKLHPDTGGSREAMARLNRVRDLLKSAI